MTIRPAPAGQTLGSNMKKPHGNTGNKHAAKPEPRKKRSFYATDTEWQRYAELAAAAGMERGEWIRSKIQGGLK